MLAIQDMSIGGFEATRSGSFAERDVGCVGGCIESVGKAVANRGAPLVLPDRDAREGAVRADGAARAAVHCGAAWFRKCAYLRIGEATFDAEGARACRGENARRSSGSWKNGASSKGREAWRARAVRMRERSREHRMTGCGGGDRRQ